MSDLQCPATIVLLTHESAAASELRELRLALVVLAADGGAAAQLAQRLASAHSCDIEAAGSLDGSALAERIEQLADSYRGESIAIIVTAPACRALSEERAARGMRVNDLCAALGHEQAPAEPIMLAVDSDGWRVLSS